MPAGRPTLYKPEYCEEIVSFCAQGFSITGFAGEIGVSRDTISAWAAEYPEFSVSVQCAKAAFANRLEKDARRIREEGGGPGSSTLVVFGLKNMADQDYQEKVINEHGGIGGGAIKMEYSDDERSQALMAFLAKTKREK